MADIPRAPLGRPPAGTWLPGIATAVAVVLALVIVKPWAQPARPGTASPMPTFVFGPVATERTGPRQYDPRLFGLREPDPAWELWPAGYVVRFGMAGPVKVEGQDGPGGPVGSPEASPGAPEGPSPGASGTFESPPPSPDASAAASTPLPDPSLDPALPENVVDIGPSDHLVALGINTPLEGGLEKVALWRVESGQPPALVPIVRLPTLWESTHFIVIAPEHPDAAGQPDAWQPGLYRLDLTSTTLEVRQVFLLVDPPLD